MLTVTPWPAVDHYYTGLRGQVPRALRFPGGRPSDLRIPLNDPADTDREYAAVCREPRNVRRIVGNVVERQRIGTTIGRNDPCPCGSGKKAKKCCHG